MQLSSLSWGVILSAIARAPSLSYKVVWQVVRTVKSPGTGALSCLAGTMLQTLSSPTTELLEKFQFIGIYCLGSWQPKEIAKCLSSVCLPSCQGCHPCTPSSGQKSLSWARVELELSVLVVITGQIFPSLLFSLTLLTNSVSSRDS